MLNNSNKIELKLIKSIFVNPPKYKIGEKIDMDYFGDRCSGHILGIELNISSLDFGFTITPSGETFQNWNFPYSYDVLKDNLFCVNNRFRDAELEIDFDYNIEESDIFPAYQSEYTAKNEKLKLFDCDPPEFWIGDVVTVFDSENYEYVCLINGISYMPPKLPQTLKFFNEFYYESELPGWRYFLTILDLDEDELVDSFGQVSGERLKAINIASAFCN